MFRKRPALKTPAKEAIFHCPFSIVHFSVWIIAITVLTFGVSTSNAQEESSTTIRYPVLAKCSGKEELELWEVDLADMVESIGEYQIGGGTQDPDTIDFWSRTYHDTVDGIITDYMDPAESKVVCDAETMTGFVQAPASLSALAARLPPWRENNAHEDLSRYDLGPVLLEYLRTYECALVERNFFLPRDSAEEMMDWNQAFPGVFTPLTIRWGDIFEEFLEQRGKIVRELNTARPTLHRVLGLLGGQERLGVLAQEVECLQRASLDIRNSFALGAEAASCMPRVWNARDPLRDTSEQDS